MQRKPRAPAINESKTIRIFAKEPQALLERHGSTGVAAARLLISYLEKWIAGSGGFEGMAASQRDAILVSVLLESSRPVQRRFASSNDRGSPLFQVRHGYAFARENCELIESSRSDGPSFESLEYLLYAREFGSRASFDRPSHVSHLR